MAEIIEGVRVHLGNGKYLAYREQHRHDKATDMYENRWVRAPETGLADEVTIDQILQGWLEKGLITVISNHDDPEGNPPSTGRVMN